MVKRKSSQRYSLRSAFPAYLAAAFGAITGAAVFFLFAAWTHYYIYLLAVLTGFLCLFGYSRLNGPRGWPRLICVALFTVTAITLGFWLFHAYRLHVLKTTVFDGISFRLFILVDPVMSAGKTFADVAKNYLFTLVFACLGFVGKDILPAHGHSSEAADAADGASDEV